jgi:multidrug efflux pump subunit AcrB
VRLQRGEDRMTAISAVTRSTIWPLLGGTAVGILAFSAIGLSPSDMGEYAGSLFWVILYSMLLSWVFAVTITPMLCFQLLKVKPAPTQADDGPVLRAYRRLLALSLRRRMLTGAALLLMLSLALMNVHRVPPGFMPESQRAQFVIDTFLKQGTDIERTAELAQQMTQWVGQHEHVANVTSFIGGGALRFMLSYVPEPRSPEYLQLLVDVDDYRSIDALLVELQNQLPRQFPEASIKVWKFMLGRGGGKKIEAAFKGPDPIELRRLAEQAKQVMQQAPELIAVQDDWRQQVPVARPVYRAERLQQFGLTVKEANQALAQTLSGRQIGSFREGGDLIPMVVRAPQAERQHVRVIENVEVYSPVTGNTVSIGQLSSRIELEWQDSLLRKIDRIPTIMAQADPAPGVLAADALNAVKQQIESIPLPPGYQLQWYGEYKASRDANAGLAASAPYGFAAMVIAVILMFNAIRQAAVIWLAVPLSLIGVVVGLVAFQTPFEFMAILGFLSLIGMMVKNAIVLVDEADSNIAGSVPPYQAVIAAAISRARPVVLGAATTIFGVAPLLFDPFFKSMAVTIMFGLLFATALTLIVIPYFYAVFMRIKNE